MLLIFIILFLPCALPTPDVVPTDPNKQLTIQLQVLTSKVDVQASQLQLLTSLLQTLSGQVKIMIHKEKAKDARKNIPEEKPSEYIGKLFTKVDCN